jgi:hypothetical protein
MKRRQRDNAFKTHVASYHGQHYSAERDGDKLNIYAHHDEHGQPAVENTMGSMGSTNDRHPIKSLADLNTAWNDRRRRRA